jgi:hypothetical protein
MKLEEAIKIKESLEELEASAETFDWGPSLSYANDRKKEALKIIRKEIRELKNDKGRI